MNVDFIFIFPFFLYSYGLDAKATSGPYKSHLLTAHKCVTVKPPYLTESRPKVEVELYNTSRKSNLARVNITVFHVIKDLQSKMKLYKWVGGKWEYLLAMVSDHCRGAIGVLFQVLNIQYDAEECSVPIGNYSIQDIDVNFLEHAFTPTRTYGRVLTRIQVYITTGTLFCYEFEILVKPA